MINISELIEDPDFCQPNGISITRSRTTIVNHVPVDDSSLITVKGILIELDSNKDSLGPQYDRNSEVITALTYERLKCDGLDKKDGFTYSADIIHYKGSNYIVRECEDLSEYGYCRSKAEKIEQDVM